MWIDVFKEQPEFGKPVLCYMTQGLFKFVSICYLSEKMGALEWIVCGPHNHPVICNYRFDYVTHWHDIPNSEQLAEKAKSEY